MLQFRDITIEGMGPYKDPETLVFPDDGVTIVFGENGHGKTSLLNAFRYALFGKVLTRGDKALTMPELTNLANAEAGKYGFKVTLRFRSGGRDYELIRTCEPRPYISKPTTDADYLQDTFLRRDGEVLPPAGRDSELKRIMPEMVSRFFLFDGELLQQYEELLRKESDMGREIAIAIERILGLPVLTKTRAMLGEQRDHAVRLEAEAAKKHHVTKEFGVVLATLEAQRQALDADIQRLHGDVAEARENKAAAEAMLSHHDFGAKLLEERDRLVKEIAALEQKLPEKQEKLREMLQDAWRWLLGDKARQEREKIQTEISTLELKAQSNAYALATVKELQEALYKGSCGSCHRQLDAATAEAIATRIAELNTSVSDDDGERLDWLKDEQKQLKTLDVPDQTEGLLAVSDSIGDIDVDIALKRGRIDEIEHEEIIKKVDQAALRKAKSDFEQAVIQIRLTETGIQSTRTQLDTVEKQIKDVQRKLSNSAGDVLAQERRRREVYSQLHDLFGKGVAEYRDRLRSRVEADATELFRKLTSDKEYKGLRINDNYGLTIVHENGQSIVVRSAGYEHIVALALVGALQMNAPLRGPIIMDSTFTRLDETHTGNVLRALPTMAKQTMLLVFRREVDPQLARNELKGKLKAEYHLQRISSFQTKIVKQ